MLEYCQWLSDRVERKKDFEKKVRRMRRSQLLSAHGAVVVGVVVGLLSG